MTSTLRSPLVVLAFFAMMGDIGLARLGYGLILPAVRLELGGAYSVYGTIATCHLTGYLLGSLFAPRLLRSGGWRTVLSASHAVVALGLLAQAMATDVWTFGIVRIVLGLATGLATVSALGAAMESTSSDRRGAASALIWAGVALGILASAPAGQWAIEGTDRWRWVSAVMALPALLVSLCAARIPLSGIASLPAIRLSEGLHVLRASAFLLLAYAFYGCAYLIYATFVMSTILGNDASSMSATALWCTYGLAAGAGSLLVFPLLASRHRHNALVASLAVAVLGAALSACSGAVAALSGALLIGLGLTATPAVASAYARERASASAGPDAIAMATVAAAIGQIAGPFAAGYMIDLASLNLIPIFVIGAYLIATICALLDRRAIHRQPIPQAA